MKSLVATALLAALGAAPCWAAAGQPAGAAPAMRAGFDAQSGRFRPLSVEEVKALEAQGLDRSSVLSLLRLAPVAKGAVTSTPYGERVDVPEEYLVQLRAGRNEQGQWVAGHDDSRLDGHTHLEAPHE